MIERSEHGRMRTVRMPRLWDVGPVVVLAGFSVSGLVRLRDGDPTAAGIVMSLLLWVPALGRRRYPVAAFAVTAVAIVAHWAPGGFGIYHLLPADAALLLVLAAVAERRPLAFGAAAAGVTELLVLATLFGTQPAGPGTPVFPLSALTLAALLFGRNRRARAELLTNLQERAERAERERDTQARAAVAEERTRIAREVHDVVSHNLSVMTALADGAGYALQSESGRTSAQQAVASVAATGREALTEMHRLLGLLRTPDESDRSPAPGLAELPVLVEQVRAAGLPTTLTVTGAPAPLGSAAQLAVYRLVQEALTNTRKHAPSVVRAEVVLAWRPDLLVISVRDDGAPAEVSDGVGHGLIGMRERFGAHGGAVTAGPSSGGGWLVEATLPLEVTRT